MAFIKISTRSFVKTTGRRSQFWIDHLLNPGWLYILKISQPRQTNGMMSRVKPIHCGNLFTTLPVLSRMTHTDITAWISYMYLDEPLILSEVGHMPLFIFQDFKIHLEVPQFPRPRSCEKPLMRRRCFVTRWSSARANFILSTLRETVLHIVPFRCEEVYSRAVSSYQWASSFGDARFTYTISSTRICFPYVHKADPYLSCFARPSHTL